MTSVISLFLQVHHFILKCISIFSEFFIFWFGYSRYLLITLQPNTFLVFTGKQQQLKI